MYTLSRLGSSLGGLRGAEGVPDKVGHIWEDETMIVSFLEPGIESWSSATILVSQTILGDRQCMQTARGEGKEEKNGGGGKKKKKRERKGGKKKGGKGVGGKERGSEQGRRPARQRRGLRGARSGAAGRDGRKELRCILERHL